MSLTTLADTSWIFPTGQYITNVQDISSQALDLTFTCNNVSYDSITIDYDNDQQGVYILYEWLLVYDDMDNGWKSDVYKQINITGGNDATNSILIDWFETFATQVVTYTTDTSELTSIANAIRTKGGTGSLLSYPNGFITAINNISTGVDVSDTTATAGKVLDDYYFYTASGVRTEGTMTNRGAVTGTISTKDGTYTIQSGYHNGSGTVAISSTEQAKIIADNIKSGVTLLGQAGSLTAWSFTWSSSTPASGSTYYNGTQNLSKTLTYTASAKCLVVCIAEVVGDAAAHSASITVTGATTKRTTNIAGQSYRRFGIYQCASGNKVTATISGSKGTKISSEPTGSIYFWVLTAS